jgi:hypothetical protein
MQANRIAPVHIMVCQNHGVYLPVTRERDSYTSLELIEKLNMKVLLIGATGNLGLRLIAALLTHGHIVVAFVRSAKKLESLILTSVFRQIKVVQGYATDSVSIKNAILDEGCDAVVNTAGLAALPPWGNGDLPEIFRGILDGIKGAALEGKRPLRVWFLAGMGVLQYPGSEGMLSD